MKDEDKTKEQLITELAEMRQRIAELEKSDVERKRVEESLKEFETRLMDFADQSPNMIFTYENGRVTYANKKCEEVTGYKREEFYSPDFDFLTLIAPEYRELVKSNFRRHINGEEVEPYEYTLIAKDGERIDVILSTSLIDCDGERAILGILTDISEHKRMDLALKESEEKFRLLFQSVSEGIVLLDTEGKVLEVNPRALEIASVEREEVVGKNFVQVLSRFKIDAPSLLSAFKDTTLGKFSERELTLTDEKGQLVFIRVHGGTIIGEGKVVGISCILEDITERKRAEEELKNSSEQLRNLSVYLQFVREEERKRIAREIHDEFGQALTALKIDLSWLGKRLPSGQKLLLEKIESMSKRIDMTIQTVRRISSELRPRILDDFGLAAAIEWQAEEFQNRTGIKCEVTLDNENIILDPDFSTMIFRIFQESLTNVARHANATRVEVSLKKKADKLVLEVKDNGKGITEEQISDPKSFGILGMRERANSFRGEVKINGIRDEGTTVTVSIPINCKEGETL